LSSAPDRIRPPTRDNILAAAAALAAGKLVAMPTETVYGLAADARSERAVAAIFEAKERPRFNPLIVHFSNAAQAADAVQFGALAERLGQRFWPGPLTLVMRRSKACQIALLASAGLETVAVRVPAHPVAQALLAAFGSPLAAPSANRSGRPSPTTASHVAEELGERVAIILDGGPCPLGIESTILDLSTGTPLLLRPGAITEEELVEIIGPIGHGSAGDGPRAPGMLRSHYAPDHPLRLEARTASADEALIAFGPDVPAGAGRVFNLSPSGDLTEAAARLFASLRQADASGLSRIAVMPIPEIGLGRAINDRLRRAAAPRR
jgi:L-threonylcarbamoyladenylate synthase